MIAQINRLLYVVRTREPKIIAHCLRRPSIQHAQEAWSCFPDMDLPYIFILRKPKQLHGWWEAWTASIGAGYNGTVKS